MPTPTHVFARIAARLGGVDPSDMRAVQEWYQESFARLPAREIEKALEELIAAIGEPGGDAAPPCYPASAPLPSLEESPPAE